MRTQRPALSPSALTFAFVAIFVAISQSVCSAQPVIIEDIVRSTPDGIVRGQIATIDLQDPRVSIFVTGTSAGTCDTTLTTTSSFRSSNNLDVAINANFFSTSGCSANRADAIGLLVSNGTLVSPVRQFGTFPDPALNITSSKIASIDYIAASTPGLYNAIAGVGPSNTDTDPGTLLITDGVNTGATARVSPLTRDPRTAVGVNKDGTLLYLVVIDGRQPLWSVGMTLPEVASLLLERGCWRAVNLDGGGSSSFLCKRANGTITQNKPSDGSFRAVSANFGVKVATTAATDRFERPIRAVWMRPPGHSGNSGTSGYPNPADLGTFESYLPNLATCGIQDIFLETFYWGRTTNNSSVYNDRFAVDYLAQAIVIAAKYGIRVHAWCEVGYQAFGTGSDYLFSSAGAGDQNGRVGDPGWRVLSASNSTIYGDVNNVGTVFVNLIHPGVRSRLSEYMAELAQYPGLEGIFLDYCRYPVDDITTDSFLAPWSFDAWSRAAFQAAAVGNGDPAVTALTSAGADYTKFTTWRRQGITDTITSLYASVNGASRGVTFAGAVFPDPLSSGQLPKMQDWGNWMTSYALQLTSPMCYSSTVGTEVNSARAQAGWRRMVPALAFPNTSGHPTVTSQLNSMNSATVPVQDFAWFDYTYFTTLAAGSANRTELRTWIDNVAKFQIGDINKDGYVDAKDLTLFNATFTGTPITTTVPLQRYDLNNDGVINSLDQRLFSVQFNRFHFGEDGVVDLRDVRALRNCFNATNPLPGILHLWDLNADNIVDWKDELIALDSMTVPRTQNLDVDGNGVVNIEDLYRQFTSPIDVGGDGAITTADTALLVRALRAQEQSDITSGRR